MSVSSERETVLLQCRAALDAGDLEKTPDLIDAYLNQHPDDVDLLMLKGETLAASKCYADATETYRRITRAIPDHLAAHIELARCAANLHHHDEAHKLYKRAFQIHPGSLVAINGILDYEYIAPDDPSLANLKREVQNPAMTMKHRALGCFLLGRIYLNADRNKEAFNWFQVGNRLELESTENPPDYNDIFSARHWTPQKLRERFGQSHPTASKCPALIITGLPRSGKSIVESLIGNTATVSIAGEHGILYECMYLDKTKGAVNEADEIKKLPSTLAHRYSDLLKKSGGNSSEFVTDTSPANLWYLGFLGYAHPDVPIVMCRRDWRDLGVSIFFTHFADGHAYSYDQEKLGKFLAQAERAQEAWQKSLPNPLMMVDYETLVSDPSETQRRLLDFLKINPDQTVNLYDQLPVVSLSPGNTRVDIGEIRDDLVGINNRFANEFVPMVNAYRKEKMLSGIHINAPNMRIVT